MELKTVDRAVVNFVLADHRQLTGVPNVQNTGGAGGRETVFYSERSKVDAVSLRSSLPSTGLHPISVG